MRTPALHRRPCLTRFFACRVQLEQGLDDEGALAALQSFTQCTDFEIDFLYLAALVRDTCVHRVPRLLLTRSTQESQTKKALRCAQEAYTILYREVTTPGSSGAAKVASCPGYFAQLMVRFTELIALGGSLSLASLPCSVI